MITLIDRNTGKELGKVTESDLAVIRDCLVEEEEWDTDYYLQDTSLELLTQAGLSPDGLLLLTEALGDHADLEFGWERESDAAGGLVGKIRNANDGTPVPGCKVELYHTERNEFWAFSREDGSFDIALPNAKSGNYKLLVTGPSDHEYWAGEVEVTEDVVVDAGVLEVNPDPAPA